MEPRSRAARMSATAASCVHCPLADDCLPAAIGLQRGTQLLARIGRRRLLRRGDVLFRAGAPGHDLHILRTGAVKGFVFDDGVENLTALYLPGDWIGTSAIRGPHVKSAAALETGVVCTIPWGRLERQARREPPLQQWLHDRISRALTRTHTHVALLQGPRDPEARLIAFLLDLSARYHALGYSATEFRLPLSRAEIGAYLGLAEETVCRHLTALARRGWLDVAGRLVRMRDTAALRALAPLDTRSPGAAMDAGDDMRRNRRA